MVVQGFRSCSVTFRFGIRQSVRPQEHSARTLGILKSFWRTAGAPVEDCKYETNSMKAVHARSVTILLPIEVHIRQAKVPRWQRTWVSLQA